MSETGRPRGLGRGLSALLGDPFAHDLSRQPPSRLAPQPLAVESPPALATAPMVGESLAAATPAEVTPASPAAAPSGEGVRVLALAQVQRNPNQPRRSFDPAELNELAESIKLHGVLQPILVRPVAQDRYEIVAGERRWRASQLAGLDSIPAQVREMADGEVLEVAIIENVQRTDLNAIEEALGYQALMEHFGRTQADVAERVGKSRPHIANMLRLLQLPADIQDMVRDGKLSAGHARAILAAPDPQELARLAVAQALSVRDVERLVQKAKEANDGRPAHTDRPAVSAADPDLLGLEQSLASALGMKVSLSRKGEGGELRVLFERADQLDDLCRRLSAAT